MKEKLSKELRLLEQAAMTIEAKVAEAQLDLMEARTRLTQSVDHQADAVSREIVKTPALRLSSKQLIGTLIKLLMSA